MFNTSIWSLMLFVCYFDIVIVSYYGFGLVSLISLLIMTIISRTVIDYYNKKLARALFIKACEMKAVNDFENAEKTMLKAISLSLDPKFKAMGFHNLGNWNLILNKVASQTYYEKAIMYDSDYFKPYVGMGWLFMTLGKLTEAQIIFEVSLNLIKKSNIDADIKIKSCGNVMNNMAFLYHKQFVDGDDSSKVIAENYYKESINMKVDVELMNECLELLCNGDNIKFISVYNKTLGI